MSRPMAHCFNHVGVSVPDIDAAIAWYGRIFGFTVIMAPAEVRRDGSHFGDLAADICGPRFGGMKIAHMVTGDGVGFELFEFLEPKPERREDTMEYWKNGFFHIAITDPDVDAKVREITENGGRQRSEIWELFPGDAQAECLCARPWLRRPASRRRRYM